MPLSLPTLLDLDTRLQRAAARLEPHTSRKTRGRVEGAIVRDIAFPRYLVWRSFLQRKPTEASYQRAAKRLRGHVFYHLALAAESKGLPLPVKAGTHVPGWTLRRIERAQQPDTTRAEDDPIDWWEQAGWDEGLYPRDLLSAEEQAAYDAWLAETLKSLDFEFWLHDVAFNDMAVLQMLDAAYNQQAAKMAGQETIAEAGLVGDFDLRDPNVLSFLQAQAGTWISSIDDTTRSFIARTLWEGFGGDMAHIIALSPEQIANEVRNIWGQLGNDLEQMSRYRARMITVTELARAETFGQMLSIMGLGIKNKEWMVTSGACIICMGNASMGAIPLMQPFPSGDLAPPGHPLCFPAGTVVAGPKPLGSSVRWYRGDLVEIRTRLGNRLTATPNHPILTPQGWVAIGSLHEGSHVLSSSLRETPFDLAAIHPDYYQAPALIEDVAVTLGGAGNVTARIMPTPPEAFHGDGADSQISVIRTNRLLRCHFESPLLKPLPQENLGWGHVGRLSLTRLGDPAQRIKGTLLTSDGIVRRLRVLATLLRRATLRQEAIGRSIIPNRLARLRQYATNHRADYTVSLTKRILRYAAAVQGKECIHVWRLPSARPHRDPRFLQTVRNHVLRSAQRERQLRDAFSRLIPPCDFISRDVVMAGASQRDARIAQGVVNECFADTESVNQRANTLSGKITGADFASVSIAQSPLYVLSFWDTFTFEYLAQSGETNAVPTSESIHRFTGEVTLDEIICINRFRFVGHVYNLETIPGWYVASNNLAHMSQQSNGTGLIVHNCRCSLAPSPDSNDPREGMYTYDPTAIADLVNNPSMQYWPNADGSVESVDLSAFGQPNQPTQVDWRSPQAAMLGWATLPESLQGLISQQPFDGALALARFGQSLAQLVDERVVQPRRDALANPHTPQDTAIAEEIITLDSLLGELSDDALDADSQAIVDTLEQNLSSLDDVLRRLRGEE